MKETGRTTFNMALEKKAGQMDPNMMAITNMVRSMEKALILGTMALNMMEIGLKTKLMVL